MQQMMKRLSIVLVALLLVGVATAGCGSQKQTVHTFEMAPLDEMPEQVQKAATAVQEAYQFAAANPEVTTKIPCYCGCGGMGHTSNYTCFVAGENEDGTLAFDDHALGCSICVDIAQDTMRLLDEGKSVDEIYTIVDNTYSRFGPPTPLEQ
jgi:hypothetical protein